MRSKQTSKVCSHQIQKRDYRRFDLEAAQTLLPIVRKLTKQAVGELAPIQNKLNNMVPADPRNAVVKASYAQIVKNWAGKMERLGLKPHGLWQLGFDCGEGWFAWQYPERSVRYFLEYNDLFSDKNLIENKNKRDYYASY